MGHVFLFIVKTMLKHYSFSSFDTNEVLKKYVKNCGNKTDN